jgi:hypothetical protein
LKLFPRIFRSCFFLPTTIFQGIYKLISTIAWHILIRRGLMQKMMVAFRDIHLKMPLASWRGMSSSLSTLAHTQPAFFDC